MVARNRLIRICSMLGFTTSIIGVMLLTVLLPAVTQAGPPAQRPTPSVEPPRPTLDPTEAPRPTIEPSPTSTRPPAPTLEPAPATLAPTPTPEPTETPNEPLPATGGSAPWTLVTVGVGLIVVGAALLMVVRRLQVEPPE